MSSFLFYFFIFLLHYTQEDDGVTLTKISGNLYQFSGPKVSSSANADLLFEKGLEAEKAGKIDEAVSLYRQVVMHGGDCSDGWVNIGTIELDRRHFALAEECYRKAIELDGSYALAYFNLANVLDETQRYEDAIAYYQNALAVKPGYGDAHYNLACTYLNIGENRKALDQYRLYLRHSDFDPKYRAEAKRMIRQLEHYSLHIIRKVKRARFSGRRKAV